MSTGVQSLPTLADAKQIAGQLIMIRIVGTTVTPELEQFLRDYRIRAVCLFRQNMVDAVQLNQLTSDLRTIMGEGALIALDEEGGAVVRPTWVPQPPSAMSLGASNDVALCRDVGAAVARAVKALGFNWNFAPVLDVNNNSHNPVIAERAFGADPARVIALAQAWMQGSLDEGVACCIKHFPGHGDTHVDSHRALPTVNKSRGELEAMELAPFRALAPEAPAIMTAHIVYPALDAEYPATMSQLILTQLLRQQWHYEGVVITDGMEMQAIAGQYGVGNAAVLALKAGADMVMALGTVETQLQTIEAMAESIVAGEVPYDDLHMRLARIHKLTQDFPCTKAPYEQETHDIALMRSAWQRGLTAYRNPIAPPVTSKIRLVMRADPVSDGVSEIGIHCATLMLALRQLYEVELVTFTDPDQFDWSALPRDGRVQVLASTVRARYSERVQSSFRPDLHLVLWNPYVALDIDAPALLTFGFAAPAMEAVMAFLRGEINALGVMAEFE